MRTVIGELDPVLLKEAAQQFGRDLYERINRPSVVPALIAAGAGTITIKPVARTCLSCGAKTNDQGEIPCGH